MNLTAMAPLLVLALLFFGGCCNQEEIPALTRRLYSKNAKDRNEAALGLARCGEESKGAVTKLSTMLYDENVGVQSSAAYALRRIDTPEARAALERAENKRKKGKGRK